MVMIADVDGYPMKAKVICPEVTHGCDTALAGLLEYGHCRRRGHRNSRWRML